MSGESDLITISEIEAATERLRPHIERTPVIRLGDTPVLLKAENLHAAGSFKTRGAFNSILLIDEPSRGVVAHSSGNHAIAVAEAAAALGIRCTIVMPADAPRIKIERTRRAGAEIIEVGPSSSERAARAEQLAAERGASLIEPYDSRAVIAATATIAIELLDHSRQVGAVYAPISGGGLIAGIAAGIKLLEPDIAVIGVEPEVAADALASRLAGRIVELPAEQMALTIADGLRVQRVGQLNWPHLEAWVDDIITVSEQEIMEAMVRVALEARLIAEPSGAVPVAAALRADGAVEVAAILCGGNVDPDMLHRAFAAR
jgi:threonine dehydratase